MLSKDIAMKILKSIDHAELQNDVIMKVSENKNNYVIFFPGDVQDYKSNMENHRDNFRWKDYCYESTLEYLHNAYMDSNIIIIRPARLHLHTFACYQNFLDCNNFGVANFSLIGGKALNHLNMLFQNIFKFIGRSSDEIEDLSIHLVGFSKGCAVLNQLVYDFASPHQQDSNFKFIKTIKSFTWLDSGTSGGSGAWLIDEVSLAKFVTHVPHINVHVTPYQIKDSNRKWIREENEMFIEILKKLDCELIYKLHFEDQKPSLNQHLSLLKVFKS